MSELFRGVLFLLQEESQVWIMHRVYFEPVDAEVTNISKFKKDWQSVQRSMLNYGILIPDICRICVIDKEGFVVNKLKDRPRRDYKEAQSRSDVINKRRQVKELYDEEIQSTISNEGH